MRSAAAVPTRSGCCFLWEMEGRRRSVIAEVQYILQIPINIGNSSKSIDNYLTNPTREYIIYVLGYAQVDRIYFKKEGSGPCSRSFASRS